MANYTDLSMIEDALKHRLHRRAEVIAAEEITAAQERVKERILQEIDSLALDLLNYYELSQNRQEIRITVKKNIEEALND